VGATLRTLGCNHRTRVADCGVRARTNADRRPTLVAYETHADAADHLTTE